VVLVLGGWPQKLCFWGLSRHPPRQLFQREVAFATNRGETGFCRWGSRRGGGGRAPAKLAGADAKAAAE
jgi:hypothetical protein